MARTLRTRPGRPIPPPTAPPNDQDLASRQLQDEVAREIQNTPEDLKLLHRQTILEPLSPMTILRERTPSLPPSPFRRLGSATSQGRNDSEGDSAVGSERSDQPAPNGQPTLNGQPAANDQPIADNAQNTFYPWLVMSMVLLWVVAIYYSSITQCIPKLCPSTFSFLRHPDPYDVLNLPPPPYYENNPPYHPRPSARQISDAFRQASAIYYPDTTVIPRDLAVGIYSIYTHAKGLLLEDHEGDIDDTNTPEWTRVMMDLQGLTPREARMKRDVATVAPVDMWAVVEGLRVGDLRYLRFGEDFFDLYDREWLTWFTTGRPKVGKSEERKEDTSGKPS
ncbi:MAG: hypothetical protein Q9221_006397 [Calogaya cf. arnoldii]